MCFATSPLGKRLASSLLQAPVSLLERSFEDRPLEKMKLLHFETEGFSRGVRVVVAFWPSLPDVGDGFAFECINDVPRELLLNAFDLDDLDILEALNRCDERREEISDIVELAVLERADEILTLLLSEQAA